MISEKLKGVILKELKLDDFYFQDSTTASMVPGWDSLNHAKIIMAVEEAYGIRLRTLEIIRLKNVGELQKLVDNKLK